MFVILWRQGEVIGCRDLLPFEWFERGAYSPELEHLIALPNWSGFKRARCSLEVSDTSAVLDYAGRHAAFNTAEVVDIGQALITFTDGNFSEIAEYRWRPNGEEYRKARVFCSTENGEELERAIREGNPQLVTHLRRERDPALAKRKLAAVIATGAKVRCEACSFSFEEGYGELGRNFGEVHHRVALAEGPRDVSLADLAVLCANCHRMIHRIRPMPTVEEFATRYAPRSSN